MHGGSSLAAQLSVPESMHYCLASTTVYTAVIDRGIDILNKAELEDNSL